MPQHFSLQPKNVQGSFSYKDASLMNPPPFFWKDRLSTLYMNSWVTNVTNEIAHKYQVT